MIKIDHIILKVALLAGLIAGCDGRLEVAGSDPRTTTDPDDVVEDEAGSETDPASPTTPTAPEPTPPASPGEPPAPPSPPPGPGPSPGPAPTPSPPPASIIELRSDAAFAPVAPGATRALTITAIYDDATTADVTPDVTYSSSAPAVATVSVSGVITGQSSGTADITATDADSQESVVVHVSVGATGESLLGFGNDGLVRPADVSVVSQFSGLAIDSLGRSIVVGQITAGAEGLNFYVARHLASGQLDPDFDSGSFDFFGLADKANAVGIQSTGRIVVCGTAYVDATAKEDFACLRLLSDGTLDTTFGTAGKASFPMGSNVADYAYAVHIQSDDKIIVAGSTSVGGWLDIALARLEANGALDATFGTSGKKIQNVSPVGRDDEALAVKLQSDGKIIAGGYIQSASGDYRLGVARFTTAGVLDTTFGGTDGYEFVAVSGANNDQKGRTFLVHDDDIYVAGTVGTASSYDVGVAKFLANGTADTNFGTDGNGALRINFSAGLSDRVDAISIDDQDRLILGGFLTTASNGKDMMVARLSTAGVLDTSFGTNGWVSYNFSDSGNKDDRSAAIGVRADGVICVVGRSVRSSASGDVGFFAAVHP